MLVNTDRCEFHKQTLPECQTVIWAPFQTMIFTSSPGVFVGSCARHDSIFLSYFLEVFYQLRSRWPCAHVLRHRVVLAHVTSLLLSAAWLDPQLHSFGRDFGGGGEKVRLPDCHPNPPIDILLLYTALYTYMIALYDWKGQYSQQGAFLGEDSWFNNQDALQKTGTWKFWNSMLESKEHTNLPGLPLLDAEMIHLFVSPKNLFQAFFTHKLDHSPSTNLAMSNSKYQAGNESMKISPDRHKVGTVYLRGPLGSLTTSSLTFGKKLSLLIVLQMICSKFCLQLGGLIGLATMKRCDSVWVAPTYQLYTPQQTEKHIGTWNWNGKETGDSYWKPSFVWGIQPPAVRTLGCVVHDLGKLDSFRPDDTRNRRTASFVGLNSWNLGTRWKLIAFILTWIISRRMASELWRYTLEFIYRQNFASFFSFLEIVSIASFFHVRIHHLIVSLFGFVSQPCHFA